jgi:hypothetical protein
MLITPFAINTDLLQNDEVVEQLKLKTFDMFFLCDENGNKIFKIDNETSYLDLLINSLKFFFKTDNIILDPKNMIIYIEDKIIHRENFDLIVDVILGITGSKRIKPEKIPEFENEKQKQIYYALQKGRKEKEEKNKITLLDIIHIVMFGGSIFIDYDNIIEWTYLRLIDAYSVIVGKENYEASKIIMAVPIMDTKGIESPKHWFESIKVNKDN